MDNEYVGVCLDTVNSLGRGEGVREVTEALMPFTKSLHVKDFTVVRNESNMAMAVVGAPAGHGKLDIPALLLMLKAHQPDASVVLEQWTPLRDSFDETVRLEEEWADSGIRYLKERLALI
jgi:3-oxoisoapionate decarboxylase